MYIVKAAALALALTAVSAQAAPSDFAACDGYSAPGKKSDGITKGTWLWGLASTDADFRKSAVTVGNAGIAACDMALADQLLVDAFWLRRAHLLQSKSMHQMATSRDKEAIETLDQSDAVGSGRNDAQFDGSIKLANRALRAIALYRLNRKDEARAALEAVAADRPWSPSLRRLMLAIRLSFEPEYETQVALLRDQAVIEPRMLHGLFWLAVQRGDFNAAVKLASELSFDMPRSRIQWSTEGQDNRVYELIGQRASVAGATAYALAAIGRVDASSQAIQEGLEEINIAIQPPVPDANGRPPSKKAMRDYDLRAAAGGQAKSALDHWSRAIEFRRSVGAMSLQQVLASENRPQGESMVVSFDFFRQIKSTDPAEQAQIAEIIGLLTARLENERRKLVTLDLRSLVQQLPRPETTAMVPKMQREGGEFLRSSANGWAVRKADDPELINVRFGSATGSEALVEEAAFLAAANHVVSLNKTGFIVVSSQLIQRTTYVSGMYTPTYSVPTGYELRLLLRPIDVDTLPSTLQQQRWRAIDARKIQTELSGKFPLTR